MIILESGKQAAPRSVVFKRIRDMTEDTTPEPRRTSEFHFTFFVMINTWYST